MHSATLNLIAPDPQAHAEAIFDLAAAQWSDDLREHCREGRINHSHYDWQTARIGLIGGQVVTHFGVYDLRLRVGTARVRAAGVNLVVTHPDYRSGGLMTRTVWAALAAMRANGYDLSVVCNAVEDYYPRFGYIFAWPESLYIIHRRDLPVEPPGVTLYSFKPGHHNELAALYNAENALLTGTAVRPTFLHTKEPGAYRGCFWAGATGAVEGYVIYEIVHDGDTLWLADSAGDARTRLRVLGLLAREERCVELHCPRLHYHNLLAQGLRRLDSRLEHRYNRSGGWMVRIVNLESTFAALAPELARRLAASPLAGWTGTLAIRDGESAITLIIGADTVQVGPDAAAEHLIQVGPELAQLVIGTEAPDEIITARGTGLRGDALALARVLFPRQDPQLGNGDL